jgi:hypothetical protein
VFDGGDDTCDDIDACNYGAEGDCEYAAFECSDGSLVCEESECATDGSISLEIDNVDISTGTLDIYMVNDVTVGGFQFNLSGVTITGASGGSAEDNGFMISTSATTILGFSLTGGTIQAGEGTLITVEFIAWNAEDEICIEDVVLSDPFGVAIDVDIADCWNDGDADDGGDDGGDSEPQYFTDLPAATGESSLIIIQDVEGLDVGDEIGIFDINGVLETVDYPESPEYGETLVGSAVWTNSQAEIAAVMSIDLSDFNGPTLNGAVDGNSIVFKVWKADEDAVYMAEANYTQGNGIFGEILTVVDVLSPIFSVEQSIDLMPYMMNSMSFNVGLDDSSVETVFEGIDLLVTSNDESGFYVPEFGVNSIGDVTYDMGLNTFISGSDMQVCTMEGVPL